MHGPVSRLSEEEKCSQHTGAVATIDPLDVNGRAGLHPVSNIAAVAALNLEGLAASVEHLVVPYVEFSPACDGGCATSRKFESLGVAPKEALNACRRARQVTVVVHRFQETTTRQPSTTPALFIYF